MTIQKKNLAPVAAGGEVQGMYSKIHCSANNEPRKSLSCFPRKSEGVVKGGCADD